MTLTNSTLDDIPEIFRLYKLATDFQVIKFPENQWPVFDKKLVTTEILEKRHYKLIVKKKTVCVWAITFNDAQIWEERDNNTSIYIHRIATNPDFRGNNFVQEIVDWARVYAKYNNTTHIRLDTCGNNVRLIDHYIDCGFTFLGMNTLKNSSDLPSHYNNADVCFFEIKI